MNVLLWITLAAALALAVLMLTSALTTRRPHGYLWALSFALVALRLLLGLWHSAEASPLLEFSGRLLAPLAIYAYLQGALLWAGLPLRPLHPLAVLAGAAWLLAAAGLGLPPPYAVGPLDLLLAGLGAFTLTKLSGKGWYLLAGVFLLTLRSLLHPFLLTLPLSFFKRKPS